MKKPLFKLIFSIKQKCSAREELIRVDLKLSHSEFHGILSLDSDTAVPGHVFAECMMLSPSRASRVVSNLLKKKYIITRFHPDDRRSQLISLTAEGQEKKELIESRLRLCENLILEKYSDEDIKVIKWALTLLDEAL
ncbi:hypothetical protein KAR48_06900 [bacterium]|nr:hypothetical protein [bacterium]